MPSSGDALKADLTLRSEYPQLRTRIFQVGPYQHIIVLDRTDLVASEVAARFDDEMRPVTAEISLSNNVPDQYIRELEPLSDREISRNFIAIPLTRVDIVNLLAAKFPAFDLAEVNTLRGGVIELVAATQPTPELQAEIQIFMDDFENFTTQIRTHVGAVNNLQSQHHSSWHIGATKLRPRSPSFAREDEEFWFDNIDEIYSGRFDLQPIPGTEDLGSACHIDFSYGNEQLNIRHALLYFDTVLVTPSIAETQDGWSRQRISDEEILELVDAGRLKFVLTQAEERGDTRILEAARERSEAAVIGRRKTAAVILADLVKTNSEYKLNEAGLRETLPELAHHLAGQLGWSPEQTARFLSWPTTSLRRSLPPLMTNGALGLSAFGQDTLLAEDVLAKTGRDLRLEMMATGFQTHLAHAFRATSIPYIGQPENWRMIYNTIGDRLNFYRSFNSRIAAAWIGNERRKEERRSILPPIPLFDFEIGIPISEFVEVTALSSSRRKGRALMTRLADLPPEEREIEVARLATQARRLRGREAGLFSFESLEDAGPLTDIIVGTSAPPFFAMRNLIRRIINLRDRSPALDRMVDAIQREISPITRRNEDLDFLSKIDRIAQLRRDRIH